MKRILANLLFLWFSMYSLELSCQEETLHIYLCSRLTEPAKQQNDIISEELDVGFNLFRPQDVNLNGVSANEMDYAIYQADFNGMNQSDILLVLPPYGRNCAWEIGWFCDRGKPSIAYVEAEGDWLHDAMVKGGLTAIITSDPILYNILVSDPATSAKSYLIPSKQDLGRIIKQICNRNNQLMLESR